DPRRFAILVGAGEPLEGRAVPRDDVRVAIPALPDGLSRVVEPWLLLEFRRPGHTLHTGTVPEADLFGRTVSGAPDHLPGVVDPRGHVLGGVVGEQPDGAAVPEENLAVVSGGGSPGRPDDLSAAVDLGFVRR